MEYIRDILGDIDIKATQQVVFAFDWASVPELRPGPTKLPDGREIWLTSFFWGVILRNGNASALRMMLSATVSWPSQGRARLLPSM
ncbi:hypothetical protein BV379_14290 [Rhodovulum sulfidophilum]|nr:hypothetical protein BV379_14290 [Rhodovulum sulfidophilum]